MKRSLHLCLAVLLLLSPLSLSAQPDWLPADVGEAMAQQIAGKIQAVDLEGKIAPEDGLVGARKSVGAIAARIQSLGNDGMLELAPDFPDLEIPVSGQPYVDAMARYGICTFPINAILIDESNSMEQRLTAAVMETGIVIVSAFFRHEFLAVGGTAEQAQAILSAPEITELSFKLQAREDLMQQVMAQCAEPLTELLK